MFYRDGSLIGARPRASLPLARHGASSSSSLTSVAQACTRPAGGGEEASAQRCCDDRARVGGCARQLSAREASRQRSAIQSYWHSCGCNNSHGSTRQFLVEWMEMQDVYVYARCRSYGVPLVRGCSPAAPFRALG